MSKNEEEIVSYTQETDSTREKFIHIVGKISTIGFFSAAVFILGFFIKVGFVHYNESYFAALNTPPIFLLDNYYDSFNKIQLLWLLIVVIVTYIYSVYCSLYFLTKNMDHPIWFATSYVIVQGVFLFFAFLSNDNFLAKFILIGAMIGAAIFIGLVLYFSKKTQKPITPSKKQLELAIILLGAIFVLVFTLTLISFNLYMISVYVGEWSGQRYGQKVKEKIVSGSYKQYINRSVKLYEEVDLIYFEKCIEKDCFGFTVNEDGKIILKEFDRSEIDHSYSRKK